MCAEEGSLPGEGGEFDEKIIKSFMRGFGKTMILWNERIWKDNDPLDDKQGKNTWLRDNATP